MPNSTTELEATEAKQLLLQGDLSAPVRVRGILDLSRGTDPQDLPQLPNDLHVDVLNLQSQHALTELPAGLQAFEINLTETGIRRLPSDLRVESRLDLTGCTDLQELPANLAVGTLVLRGCTSILKLPENMDVWFLDLTGCWALKEWPKQATIRCGRLRLRGCMAIEYLPEYLQPLAALDVRDCPNLRTLPNNLQITGWLDLAHSGLTNESCLSPSLRQVQLRWSGVDIDQRIAFQPESITAAEILAERNAERRRVLLDRCGYARFLQDAGAAVIDSDTDPGGPRELLKIALEGDEDLVAMSCFCPSTARQYFIRVPPTTPTCRHAAAWIAGFDDPNEYQPLVET